MPRITLLGVALALSVWDLAAQPAAPPPDVVAPDGLVFFSGRNRVGGSGGPVRPTPAGDGVIEGTVVNALTGAPIRRARVMLYSDDSDQPI